MGLVFALGFNEEIFNISITRTSPSFSVSPASASSSSSTRFVSPLRSSSSSLSSIIRKIQNVRSRLQGNRIKSPQPSPVVSTISVTSQSPLAQKLASELTTNELIDLLKTKVNVKITPQRPVVSKPSISLETLASLENLSDAQLQDLVASDPELKALLLGVPSDYISPDLVNLSRQQDVPSQNLLSIRQEQLNDKMDLMLQQLNLKNSLEQQLQTKQSDSTVLNSLLLDYQKRLEMLTNNYKVKFQALQQQSINLTPQIQQDQQLKSVLGKAKLVI